MSGIFTTYNIILGVLVASLLICSYIIRNLMLKLEKHEDALDTNNDLVTRISTLIDTSNARLKELDTKGAFAADDETGYFFENLKIIQSELDNFVVPVDDGQKTKQE